MKPKQPKSIVLGHASSATVFRTFEDWQADQLKDTRPPAARGINVGMPVLWRHKKGKLVLTERAIVLAIKDMTLTIEVKDVTIHTQKVHVNEIFKGGDETLSMRETNTRTYQLKAASEQEDTSK